ncbi:MAG: hypothetical protein L0191_06110 [Acidobacteria bacterium]|nr:hypothetical protein [Acidobacteriota bacterium]
MSVLSPDRREAQRRDDLRTLGLLPGAAAEGILQAYLKLRRALRSDSPALRTAASEEERRAMLQRVEEAYLRLAPQAGQPIPGSGPRLRACDPASPAWTPEPDLRARPTPFRARPSLPLR